MCAYMKPVVSSIICDEALGDLFPLTTMMMMLGKLYHDWANVCVTREMCCNKPPRTTWIFETLSYPTIIVTNLLKPISLIGSQV